MKTAACLFVREGSHNIVEWIAHHATIGFDTIFVVDNCSSDNTRELAQSAARLHDVRVSSWLEEGPTSKTACYDDVLARHSSHFDWMAFVDVDEFIMPLRDGNIKAFLSNFEDHPAVALNWAIFGSSGHRAAPRGLLLEQYTKRSDQYFPSNRHVKSIIRPGHVRCAIDRHIFELCEVVDKGGYLRQHCYVDSLGRPIEWGSEGNMIAGLPEFEVCRINHYYTRSRADFDMKMLQKMLLDATVNDRHFYYNDRNECVDLSARPFAEKVHVFADQIRPSVKFLPAKYGFLPTIPFGTRYRDYIEPDQSRLPFPGFPVL